MSTESHEERLAACRCGSGVVNERFWSNDHPFASDVGWHHGGLRLHCDPCEKDWTLHVGNVANPSQPPEGQRVAYWVAKGELERVAEHNRPIHEKSRKLAEALEPLQRRLSQVLSRVRFDLQAAAAPAKGLSGKFDVLRAPLGFATLDAFREEVGRTRPNTYVPRLVTEANVGEVLTRMGRQKEAEDLETIRIEIDRLIREARADGGALITPTADAPFYYTPGTM